VAVFSLGAYLTSHIRPMTLFCYLGHSIIQKHGSHQYALGVINTQFHFG